MYAVQCSNQGKHWYLLKRDLFFFFFWVMNTEVFSSRMLNEENIMAIPSHPTVVERGIKIDVSCLTGARLRISLQVFCIRAKVSLDTWGLSSQPSFSNFSLHRGSRGRLCSWLQHFCFWCCMFIAATVKKKVTHNFHTFFQANKHCLGLKWE